MCWWEGGACRGESAGASAGCAAIRVDCGEALVAARTPPAVLSAMSSAVLFTVFSAVFFTVFSAVLPRNQLPTSRRAGLQPAEAAMAGQT